MADTPHTTVYLGQGLREAVDRQAKDLDISRSGWIRMAIMYALGNSQFAEDLENQIESGTGPTLRPYQRRYRME